MTPVADFGESLGVANDLLARRDYVAAEAAYRNLLALKPEDVELHERLTIALFGQQQIDAAVEHYRSILFLDRSCADPEYDAVYLQGLVRTGACPSPFKRRARFHSLARLLREADNIPGNCAECGCYRGLSSFVICETLRKNDARFKGEGYHIFDSFEGLSDPTIEDEADAALPNADELNAMCQAGNFSASLAQVKRNLESFPDITYHPGWIPLSFRDVPDLRFRFVHLDVDLYDPTLDALEYFMPRLSPGGMIVSDDYSWPGARRAIEEFCAERGTSFSVTPQQQAVIRS